MKLLSLSDEALSHLYHHLGASNTPETFQGPRDSLALAKTNSRLLRLFRAKLTRITPNFENAIPKTLSPQHLFAVARLAGEHLREWHLGAASDFLPQLSTVCPNLKTLSFFDDTFGEQRGLAEVLRLPLNSLALTRPSVTCLRMLVPPPPQLSLYELEYRCYDALPEVLRQPPKHLKLTIQCSKTDLLLNPSFVRMRTQILEAIPKMSSIEVDMSPNREPESREVFANEAVRLISAARQNSEDSFCVTVKLVGEYTFHILQKVHPKANITLKRWDQRFIDTGNGMYANMIPLYDCYLEEDLSFLEEVRIENNCNPNWKAKLDGIRLKKAFVLSPRAAEYLSLSAETVEIPARFIIGEDNWTWLANVRRLRVIGEMKIVSTQEYLHLFQCLTTMLNSFRGDIFWLPRDFPFYFSQEHVYDLSRAFRDLINAVEGFKQHGGDVGTVEAMIKVSLTGWHFISSALWIYCY